MLAERLVTFQPAEGAALSLTVLTPPNTSKGVCAPARDGAMFFQCSYRLATRPT